MSLYSVCVATLAMFLDEYLSTSFMKRRLGPDWASIFFNSRSSWASNRVGSLVYLEGTRISGIMVISIITSLTRTVTGPVTAKWHAILTTLDLEGVTWNIMVWKKTHENFLSDLIASFNVESMLRLPGFGMLIDVTCFGGSVVAKSTNLIIKN